MCVCVCVCVFLWIPHTVCVNFCFVETTQFLSVLEDTTHTVCHFLCVCSSVLVDTKPYVA